MILFTADWHLKLGQKNVPKDWALNRYKLFFEQLGEIERRVDLHIIGGDLFDRLPSMEELSLYFDFVRNANVETIIYDGNHEASKKNQTFLTYLKTATSSINPKVRIVDTMIHTSDWSILPYCFLHRTKPVNPFDVLDTTLPLFTHVRGEIPPHVKPEIDLDLLSEFPIVLAGDLHAHSNSQRNIVYPGSPMTTSFHRTEVSTGYILFDETDWSWAWEKFDLPQLIRKTVSSEEEMVSTKFHHTIYELEGNLKDLSNIKNSDLLDKKVVKRSSEATLILGGDMTIEQELAEYLTYILELDEEQVRSAIATFRDYNK